MTPPRLAPHDSPRRWSLARWLRVVAIVCIVAALAAITAGGVALSQLTSARVELLDELDPALLAAQSLAAAMINQETGVRGFAATGDPEFQTPYRLGRAQQDAAVAALRRLATVSARPALGRGLDGVLARAAAWQADYAEPTIAMVGATGPGSVAVDPAVGKERFDALRTALDTQTAALTRARSDARARIDVAAGTLLAVAVAIAVGLAGLMTALGLWIRRTVTAPITALTADVRIVVGGAFDHPVPGQGPQELITLAADIDSMRRRIVGELITVRALNTRLDGLNQRLENQAAELALSNSDLARSNSDLEQFAYVASHDLQEPLRKVSSFCELLATRYGGQLDDRADQYIGFAVDGAHRMSVLINDLLAFSRVGRATTRDTWTPLEGEALLEGAIRNLADAVETSGATITHDPLPTVVGESSLLTALFQNLVANGIKFRTDAAPRIHIGAERGGDGDGQEWTFRVTDNGVGIDPAYAERIFVIFQRLHAKEAYPGTGIGLALCRKIVDYHGGRIWLDPDTTTGSTFCFTLPAVVSRSSTPATQEAVASP